MALGSFHRIKPNIASSIAFKDTQQLYYSGTLRPRVKIYKVAKESPLFSSLHFPFCSNRILSKIKYFMDRVVQSSPWKKNPPSACCMLRCKLIIVPLRADEKEIIMKQKTTMYASVKIEFTKSS